MQLCIRDSDQPRIFWTLFYIVYEFAVFRTPDRVPQNCNGNVFAGSIHRREFSQTRFSLFEAGVFENRDL